MIPSQENKRLHVVGAELPEPPYEPFVRANGYHFQIDTERLFASSTWRMAPPEIKNALLRSWIEAWAQIPLGTLPADDVEIAAIIELPLIAFQSHRLLLMRGWVKCSDRRHYHTTITEFVLKMLAGRRTHADRVAAWRDKGKQRVAAENVNRHLSATEPSVTPLGLGLGLGDSKSKAEGALRASRLPVDWVLPKNWGEWALKERKDWKADDVRIVALRFKNHWIAKSGRNAAKLDWYATWQNWVTSESRPKRSTDGGALPWFTSEATVLAKAAELGMAARKGESLADLKGRISAKIGGGA